MQIQNSLLIGVVVLLVSSVSSNTVRRQTRYGVDETEVDNNLGYRPVGPTGPVGPIEPVRPGGEGGYRPVGPTGPVEPVRPEENGGYVPVIPTEPVGPSEEGGYRPVGPTGPVEPVGPGENGGYRPGGEGGHGHGEHGHGGHGEHGHGGHGEHGHGGQGEHGHGEHGHGHGDGEHHHGMPYDFGYDVNDVATGNQHSRKETSDDNGVITGSYQLVEPDGSLRIVEYTADWKNGFHAKVKRIPNFAPPPPTPTHTHGEGGYVPPVTGEFVPGIGGTPGVIEGGQRPGYVPTEPENNIDYGGQTGARY